MFCWIIPSLENRFTRSEEQPGIFGDWDFLLGFAFSSETPKLP
jgi:hypothetical protein